MTEHLSRRELLRTVSLSAAAIGGGSLLPACGSDLKGSGSNASDTLKIGYVSPQTGALASRKIEIVVKDSQSSPTRAAELARELILNDKVDIVVGSSTPDTTNPVADQCEANGMPNVTTIAPCEALYFGRGAKQGDAFTYTVFGRRTSSSR